MLHLIRFESDFVGVWHEFSERPKSFRGSAGKTLLEGAREPATWLFLAQGNHGIDVAGPPRGDDRSCECDCG